MGFRTKEELFGDDGPNGPKVPIDLGTTPGYGLLAKAIGYGEQLTSFIANRLGWALALNDEDLQERLAYLEAHGLDGPYRLGIANVPGGGRVITADGGAVESKTMLAVPASADAAFRASTLSDSVPGSMGFEFVGRAGGADDPSEGIAARGFSDRRAIALNSARTNVPVSATGLLNKTGSANTASLTIDTPGFWSASGATDIIERIDLVQVLDGPYVGLYVLSAVDNADTTTLRFMGGAYPVFAADTAVTFQLFRPVFHTSGRQLSDGDALNSGVVIAGLPGDTEGGAALTLIPGGRSGASSPAREGASYALALRMLGPGINSGGYPFRVSAAGEVETQSMMHLHPEPAPARNFGWPGHRHIAEAGTGPYATGFVAKAEDPAAPFYGLLVQARHGAPLVARFATEGRVCVRIDDNPGAETGDPNFKVGALGALVELYIGAQAFGVYTIIARSAAHLDLGVDPLGLSFYWHLRSMDGGVPAFPMSGAVSAHVLQGTALVANQELCFRSLFDGVLPDPALAMTGSDVGRENYEQAYSYGETSARIVGPRDSTDAPVPSSPTALHLVSQSRRTFSFFIRATNEVGAETFSVRSNGVVNTMTLVADRIKTDRYKFAQPLYITDRAIPPSLWSARSAGWLRRAWGWGLSSVHPADSTLIIPLTGFLPRSMKLTGVTLKYDVTPEFSDISWGVIGRSSPAVAPVLVASNFLPYVDTAALNVATTLTFTTPLSLEGEYEIQAWITEASFGGGPDPGFLIHAALASGTAAGIEI